MIRGWNWYEEIPHTVLMRVYCCNWLYLVIFLEIKAKKYAWVFWYRLNILRWATAQFNWMPQETKIPCACFARKRLLSSLSCFFDCEVIPGGPLQRPQHALPMAKQRGLSCSGKLRPLGLLCGYLRPTPWKRQITHFLCFKLLILILIYEALNAFRTAGTILGPKEVWG